MASERNSTGNAGESGASRPPPTPRAYRRRLANLTNVRTALADVVRRLEDGKVETGQARALIYGLSVLAGIIQGTDLEARIAALEARKG